MRKLLATSPTKSRIHHLQRIRPLDNESYSSFEYDEFGTIEVCYYDRVIVRPIRGDHSITIDAVLFDRHSNFVGPISEIVGGSNVPRYVVRSDEICRRMPLRQGDTLYYYNCDRVGKMDMEEDEYEEDLKLINMKSEQRTQSSLNLRKVVYNLKNLRIDDDYQDASMIIDERDEAISREAKASPSTNSLIYQLKQKKRQAHSYRKSKDQSFSNERMDEEVATLGKRCQPVSNPGRRRHKKISGTHPHRSSGSSQTSHISEPNTMYKLTNGSVSGLDFRGLLQESFTSQNMMEEQLPGCWLFQNGFQDKK